MPVGKVDVLDGGQVGAQPGGVAGPGGAFGARVEEKRVLLVALGGCLLLFWDGWQWSATATMA